MAVGYGTAKGPLPAPGDAQPAAEQKLLDAVAELQDTTEQKVTAAGVDFSAGEPAHPVREDVLGADTARLLAGAATAPTVANAFWVAGAGGPTIAFTWHSSRPGRRVTGIRICGSADGVNAWNVGVYKVNAAGVRTLIATVISATAAADFASLATTFTTTLGTNEYMRFEWQTAAVAVNRIYSMSVLYDKA